ncbi:MAG: CoA transferase [Gammaproteobacteria bacterium]|nr:CoA transferase [Gammaproteobacteria bacterium]
MGALDGLRVVDFGHYVAGPVTGMLLADQGAEVIKIDPPGGPAFASPANATWNRGKRSICLDLKKDDDVGIAKHLARTADVLIENFRPGVMDRLGLGESGLRRDNPGLIYTCMPGFAAEDPRSELPAWEGVILAATDVFRPFAEYREMVQVLHQSLNERTGTPVFTAEPIASMYAALLAATATSAALNVRAATTAGQRVEVPLFDAMLQAVGVFGMARLPYRPITQSVFSGLDHQYQCADGRWVHIVCTIPRHGALFAEAAGYPEIIEKGMTARSVGADEALNKELTALLTKIFRTRPAVEWEALFAEHGIPGAMCRSTKEWLTHPQAVESDLLVTVEDPSLGPMRQPGIQVKLSETPGAIKGPAPEPDADRTEILQALAQHEAPRPIPERAVAPTGLPLQGLRVLDLCIVLAGPTCGRTLAEFGADVIKIDDPNRGEVVYHHDINRGKRSILLDLKSDEGLEVFWQLVETADVIVQNYRSGVVERLGIDYASVRAVKPDIIYASLNAYGDTGPWAELPGYEEAAQALTGMQVRFGGAEKPTLWPYGVINDYGTGFAGAYGVLLALLSRAQTGKGQLVTSALARTACTLQSLHLQDYAGKTWDEPHGPYALGSGPTQRLYQCRDGWIFVGAKLADDLVRACGFDNGDNLQGQLDSWCKMRDIDEALVALTAGDIGAHALTGMNALVESKEVQSRGLVIVREHEKLGPMRTSAPAQWLSASQTQAGCPARPPGSDAQSVLDELERGSDLAKLVSSEVIRQP